MTGTPVHSMIPTVRAALRDLVKRMVPATVQVAYSRPANIERESIWFGPVAFTQVPVHPLP